MYTARLLTVSRSAGGGGCQPRGCVCLGGGCVFPGGVYLGGVYRGCTHTPPLWTEFLTHACENITFSQLLLQAVINLYTIILFFEKGCWKVKNTEKSYWKVKNTEKS